MLARADLKVILFDMDGVLVDVSRSYRRAIEETVMHFTGRKIPASTVQRYKNVGGFDDDWKLTHAIIANSGMDVPFPRVIEEFQKRYRGENWDGFIAEEPPFIKTRTLDELCRISRIMGLVTGRPKVEACWTLERFGWKKYFPLVVSKEKQEGRRIPDPFPLQHALAILSAAGLDATPEQSVYVGDAVDDVRAARAAGLWSIGLTPPCVDEAAHADLLQQHGAHVILRTPDELPAVIREFPQHVAVEVS